MPPQDVLRRRFFVHGGDRIYIYPDNLNAKATLWLWQLRDLAVIGIGLLIAVLALTQLGLFLPIEIVEIRGFAVDRVCCRRADGQRQARRDGENHCEDSFSFHYEVLLVESGKGNACAFPCVKGD